MQDYAYAVELLCAGKLVAFPTETVYGLGADATNPEAVFRIFAIKNRPADHPLIVHLPSAEALDPWARSISPTACALAEAFWPGPLTLVLPRAPGVLDVVTGGQDTVAVRVPSHPVALELLRAYAQECGGHGRLCGIAAPSANRFGRISPTRAEHVREEFGETVPLVIDGGTCPVGIESTILDLSRGESFAPRLLRPGGVSPDRIETVLGARIERADLSLENKAPRVPGSLFAHYAPQTPLDTIPSPRLPRACEELTSAGKKIGVIVFSSIETDIRADAKIRLPGTPEAYAHELYDSLRALDASGCDAILAEAVPDDSRWAAIADRLLRASSR
ncbi:MAG: threonylcarbamoyl-AMP synthase [Candidatus Accumulibacter sp.]|jgi:L-threonylcarbamoyladenylate synthase|nr:threonylcarbamoyl-AMP synthase [Accumulibacter sp.]